MSAAWYELEVLRANLVVFSLDFPDMATWPRCEGFSSGRTVLLVLTSGKGALWILIIVWSLGC